MVAGEAVVVTANDGLDPPRAGVDVVVRLTAEPLDVAAAHTDVVHPEAGGVAIFTGVVRNHHEGDAVHHLEYEAWVEQAEAAMHEVVDEVVATHRGVRAVHVSHRVGRLEIGDVAVVCATSAPHRAEALAATTMLIDTVKQRVPVWKQETLTAGDVRWPGSP